METEIEELKLICPDVRVATEAGKPYYLLKNLTLPDGCNPALVDALLCPWPRENYPSRLFFAERIRSPKTQNWNSAVRILDQNWYAYSWKLNTPGQRLAQLLANHLRAL